MEGDAYDCDNILRLILQPKKYIQVMLNVHYCIFLDEHFILFIFLYFAHVDNHNRQRMHAITGLEEGWHSHR